MSLSKLNLKTRINSFYMSGKTEFIHLMSYPLDAIVSVINMFLIVTWIVLAGLSFADKGSTYEKTFPSIVIYGTIMFMIVSSIMWMVGRYVRRQQLFGTMEQIYMAPTDMITVMIFSAFGRSLFLVIVILVTVILFGLLFPVTIGNVILAGIIFIGGILAALGISLFFGAATMGMKRAEVLNNLVSFAAMFLMAAFFPFSFLPRPLRIIALFLPVAYATDALRAVMINNWSPELMQFYPAKIFTYMTPIGVEILVIYVSSIILIILGLFMVKKAEKHLLKKSGLGEY